MRKTVGFHRETCSLGSLVFAVRTDVFFRKKKDYERINVVMSLLVLSVKHTQEPPHTHVPSLHCHTMFLVSLLYLRIIDCIQELEAQKIV